MADPKYKTKNSIGAEKKLQLNYNEMSKATKQLDVLSVPSVVIAAAAATAGAKVGKGNVCRVFGTAADLVKFGAETPAAVPQATDQDAVQLGATVVSIVATEDYIRTTAGVTRVEVTED